MAKLLLLQNYSVAARLPIRRHRRLAWLPGGAGRGSVRGYAAPVHDLEKYRPEVVESDWYEWWQRRGLFRPRRLQGSSPSSEFSMLLPPPNVTGALHIGHALTLTIQDAIARWNRMHGRSVNWVPGTDHAGISMQSVVEKKLMREAGETRHSLGRDRFVERVWKWKREHGDRIKQQTTRIGASLNWDQEYFTMDPHHSQIVRDAFIRLYDDGLVYRATRMVNWSCALQSVISDIEVDKIPTEGRTLLHVPGHKAKVEFGVLHAIEFRVVDPPENGPFTVRVETTRPETMLGDVALAINSHDARYAITPAHDENDYACAQRHGLPVVPVFGRDGRIASDNDAGQFCGMNRWEARIGVINILSDAGVYAGKRDAAQSVISRCSRSGDIIEPMLLPQWYVQCNGLARRADALMRGGEIELVPSRQRAVWHSWMSGIKDWCVSRQLWWGHRIPVYRVCWGIDGLEDSWVAAENEHQAKEKAAASLTAEQRQLLPSTDPYARSTAVQDDDVLDTWFSSGLLPLTVFNSRDQANVALAPAPIGKAAGPRALSSVLETGQDILFFWVARMAMLCTYFAKIPPFSAVLLHPMVRDAQGRKMSKSLGNIIDPMDVINGATLSKLQETLKSGYLPDKELRKSMHELKRLYPQGFQNFGADALRFTLVLYTQQTQQINMSLDNVKASYHFCNKLWNAFRFVHMHSARLGLTASDTLTEFAGVDPGLLTVFDRALLSRLQGMLDTYHRAMGAHRLAAAAEAVREFVQRDLCDRYIEASKLALSGHASATGQV
ncbi:hypothetical protein GGF46_005348 [Coemansia sp. RSA 552]|nr:hypothetical protein GGF46_005348 [Coemansia sp. RSA 552]